MAAAVFEATTRLLSIAGAAMVLGRRVWCLTPPAGGVTLSANRVASEQQAHPVFPPFPTQPRLGH